MEKKIDIIKQLQPIRSTASLRSIAEEAESEYSLLSLKPTNYSFGAHALERMVRIADDTGASMVYADHYCVTDGKREAHPVIDLQEGALRDDFDFGGLILVRNESLRSFFKENPTEYEYAGVYAMRLYMQRTGIIFHIKEYLYTEEEWIHARVVRNSLIMSIHATGKCR